MTFASQKTLFGFLVMVYDREGHKNKFSNENFGIGFVFMLPIT